MYYNDEQKQRFLDESAALNRYTPENIINFRSLFKKVSEYEILFGKDVSCFTREDISNMYSAFKYGNTFTYNGQNSKLSAYTEWCVSNALVPDGCNHFREFSMSDYKNYINERVQRNQYLTKDDVIAFVETITNPRDQFFVLSLFEFGKSPNYDEIFELKMSDVEIENHKANLITGRVVTVSDLWIRIAQDADETLVYTQPISGIERTMLPDEHIFKKVPTGGAILERGMQGDSNGTKYAARLIKQLIDRGGINKGINASSIVVSGQFDMIARLAAKYGITKEEVIKKHFDELKAQYNLSPNEPGRYFNRFGAYL